MLKIKHLVFGLVALLRMQAIYANQSNNCETHLAELRGEASNFFSNFEPVHDTFDEDVKQIEIIYGGLYTALAEYTSDGFGIELSTDQIRSEMKEFTDILFSLEMEAWDIMHRTEQKLFELTEMIRCFKIGNNLTCQRHSPTISCNADLNTLRCDLKEFLEGLEKDFGVALRSLDVFTNLSTFLANETRNFCSNNKIYCGPSCTISDKELRRNIDKYFAVYNSQKVLNAHSKLEKLDSSCNALVNAINTWQARLS